MLKNPGLPVLAFPKSKFEINVSPRVKKMRPYVAAVIARGLNFDNFLIKQMIQAQEKLDASYGRHRKKTSIGIYNLELIQSPLEYKVVDRSYKFIPLQFDKLMTIDEILEQHPKGIEYRHIHDPYEKVPLLVSKGGVLSLPPIINSNDVGRITKETKEILVEVTGTDHDATNTVLAVFAQILHARKATVESVKVNYPKKYPASSEVTPIDRLNEIVVNIGKINQYLGINIGRTQIIELIKKRRMNAVANLENYDEIFVQAAPWRVEILHWVDLAEEVAIAYGYNNFKPKLPSIFTQGKLLPSTNNENTIREILVGCALQEVLNYNLTDLETITGNILRGEEFISNFTIKLKNPVTKTYGYLRPDILPGLIRFVARNSESVFPQHIFEIGESSQKDKDDIRTFTSVAVTLAGANETFETAHRILDTLFTLLNIPYKLKPATMNFFMPGRSANVYSNKKIVGHIGEIKPEILEKYRIQTPISAFEIDLSKISKLKIVPHYTNRN